MTASTISSVKNNPVFFILEYSDKIESGEIITSRKVGKVYKKLADEIRNPTKRWIYDHNKANHAISFIEKYCKHSKGRWGGKPVILELWQKALVSAAFGFIGKETGLRRFTKVLLMVARKNGKSTLAAAIGLYMLIADGEHGSEVYAVATKKDQAKLIWKEAKRMVNKSPALKKRIKTLVGEIVGIGKYADNFFMALGSDSDTLDGLNVHCALMDETHAWKEMNLFDVIADGVTARDQPMLVETTTAGTVREAVFDEEYTYASNVIDGIEGFEDERILPIIYELDNKDEWIDPEAWVKANPGLETIKDKSKLAEKVEMAKRVKSKLNNLLCKDFNVIETVSGSWLSFSDINNTEECDLNNFRESYCIGGVDLSSTTDLTCATILLKRPRDSKIYVFQQYFMPSELIEQRAKEDKVPYDVWEQRGLITACEGGRVNYTDVTNWFIKLRDQYQIYPLWIGFDNWGAQYWQQEMKQNGFVMEQVIQGAKTMSTPMKELAAEFIAGNVVYNNNPVLKWCLTNTQIKSDDNENIRPIKGKSKKQRIDGTVSLIDAYVIYMRYFESYNNMIQGSE